MRWLFSVNIRMISSVSPHLPEVYPSVAVSIPIRIAFCAEERSDFCSSLIAATCSPFMCDNCSTENALKTSGGMCCRELLATASSWSALILSISSAVKLPKK
jgi:hypothetical protein